MAVPPNNLWPIGAEGAKDDPYVIAYMPVAAWLHEIPAVDVRLSPSPTFFRASRDFQPWDCVQVEVRFRALVEARELKRAREDNQPPSPELWPLREEARQSLRDAFTILRSTLQERAQQGLYGASETLSDHIWWANSRLNCDGAPPDVPLRRVILEDVVRTIERGARHLDLPPDFWRAMLAAVNHLGLVRQHHQYQKVLNALHVA